MARVIGMGENVEFASNGSTAGGYLALPDRRPAPGIVVVQEWWGLVPQIRHVCDRLAGEGYAALAPDLYHGEIAEHTEMDKAQELMQSLPPDRAARDMRAAVTYLLDHEATSGQGVGVVGFCMGGMLTLLLAAIDGERVRSAVPYYGAPLGESEPDWSGMQASVLGHFAERDDFFPPDAVRPLEQKLHEMGKDVTFHYYPGTGHAFGNEEDPLGNYDAQAADQAWARTLEHLHRTLA